MWGHDRRPALIERDGVAKSLPRRAEVAQRPAGAISRTQRPTAHQTEAERRSAPSPVPTTAASTARFGSNGSVAGQQGGNDDGDEPDAAQTRQRSHGRRDDRQPLAEAQRVQPENAVAAEDHRSAGPGVLHATLVHRRPATARPGGPAPDRRSQRPLSTLGSSMPATNAPAPRSAPRRRPRRCRPPRDRIRAPDSLKTAAPRAPSAGLSVSRSKVSSCRPFGPCSAESSSAITDWPMATATRSSAINGINLSMAVRARDVAGVEQ